MTKISILEKKWAYEELREVRIKNAMASILIEASATGEVNLYGDLAFNPEVDDFNIEDYFAESYADGVFTLELMELPARQKDLKAIQLKLGIPAGIALDITTDNYPLSIVGLSGNLKTDSENGPVSISNCECDMHIESENGPVRVRNSSGNIFAKLENGPISAEDISGEGLHLESENGPIKMRLASFKTVEIQTENGPIYYETLPVDGANMKFETENGIVHLVLPINYSFSLKAETESGRVKSKLDAEVTHEDNTFRIEQIYCDTDEVAQIEIITENGLIKLSGDSHINLDFIKVKLNQVKEALDKANTSEEKEMVMDLVSKVLDYLKKAAGSINEEKVKEKVNEAIAKLKSTMDDFNIDDTTANIKVKVEDISSEIYDGVREGLKNAKAEFDGLKYEHLNAESLKDYINKVVNSPLIKPYLGSEKKKAEKEEIAERSRLKILDMLEKGKITSEEAERLLNAIGKE
jgi:DUF4097 and DUF4098 domain-containing protein YvlB